MSYEKSTIKPCLWCGKEFKAYAFQVRIGKGRFCSKPCYDKSLTIPEVDRFWKFVNKTATCWLWTGHRNIGGYGQFVTKNHNNAHRFSWELHFGEISDGLCVLHDCPGGDNPACCNPAHLWLGSIADNNADKGRKGRQAHGEKQGLAKLTDVFVLEMRQQATSGIPLRIIANAYGVSGVAASNAIYGRTWKHVPGAIPCA